MHCRLTKFLRKSKAAAKLDKKVTSVLKLIGVNFIILLVMMTLIEMSLELSLRYPSMIPNSALGVYQSYYGHFDRLVIQYSKEHAEYDENYFYRLKPGKKTYSNREFNTQFEINSMGFRDDEESAQKPEIIFLGDSHTMGWGVEKEETFVDRIENKLNLKCLNTGISSFATVRELKLLKQLDISSTKAIVIQYCSNDSSENCSYVRNNYELQISSEKKYLEYSVSHDKDNDYYPFKHLIKISGLFGDVLRYRYSESTNTISDYQNEAEIAFAKVLLRELASIPSSIPLIVLNIDGRKCDSGFITRLRAEIAAEEYVGLKNQIKIIDIAPIIQEDDYYLLDDHLKKSGHEKIANILIKELQR